MKEKDGEQLDNTHDSRATSFMNVAGQLAPNSRPESHHIEWQNSLLTDAPVILPLGSMFPTNELER